MGKRKSADHDSKVRQVNEIGVFVKPSEYNHAFRIDGETLEICNACGEKQNS